MNLECLLKKKALLTQFLINIDLNTRRFRGDGYEKISTRVGLCRSKSLPCQEDTHEIIHLWYLSEGNNVIAGNNARFSEKVLVREIFARWCS